MPVKGIIPEEPVPLYLFPDLCDLLPDGRLCRIFKIKVLLHCEESFDKESCLHKVSTVILGAELDCLACCSVQPVRIRSVEALCLLIKEGHDVKHSLRAFLTGDETALYTYRDSHDSETGTAGCHRLSGIQTLTSKSAYRMGIIPEVSKCLLLDKREKLLIRNPLELIRSVECRYYGITVWLDYAYTQLLKSQNAKRI